jgi:hypothetical protein
MAQPALDPLDRRPTPAVATTGAHALGMDHWSSWWEQLLDQGQPRVGEERIAEGIGHGATSAYWP